MTEKIPSRLLANEPFSHWEFTIKDTFNLKGLYVRIHDFLKDEEWKDMFAGRDDYEVFYNELFNDNGTMEHTIWWRAYNSPHNDARGNLKFYLKLDMVTRMMKKTEVMIQGRKVELDSGELKITCSIFIDRESVDKDVWDNHFILKHFKNHFWNRTNKGVYSSAKKEAYAASRDLYKVIQVYTGVQSEPSSRDFFPVKGAFN